MESFINSVEKITTDSRIINYFTRGESPIDLQAFIHRYIEVDKILSQPNCNLNSSDVLYQLKCSLEHQAQQMTHLATNVQNSLSSFHDSLKNITSTEFKTLLHDHFQSLQIQLQHQTNPSIIKEIIQNFQDKIINMNSEQLNDIDRKSLLMLSNFQSNLLKDISTTLDSHTIHHKITSINDTLTLLHNNFTGNSSQNGKMTENILYHNLLQAFPDSDVILTRDQSDSCDIQIKRDGQPTILIDSKHCEASNVRKSDLVKFYEDCQLNDSCGILCNTFGGIANRKHFEIDIKDKRVFVFLSNHQFDPVMFQLAVRIIYNVHSIIKDQRTNVIQIDHQLYQRLKIEYNFFLHSFQQHLDNIKQNVNALSQLTLSQIDHFFKRTTLHTDQTKQFSCHLCGTGCSSTKALKKHLKDKHNFVMSSGRGRPKKQSSDEEMEQDEVEC